MFFRILPRFLEWVLVFTLRTVILMLLYLMQRYIFIFLSNWGKTLYFGFRRPSWFLNLRITCRYTQLRIYPLYLFLVIYSKSAIYPIAPDCESLLMNSLSGRFILFTIFLLNYIYFSNIQIIQRTF